MQAVDFRVGQNFGEAQHVQKVEVALGDDNQYARSGRSFAYYQILLDVIRQRMGEDAVRMYEWFDRVGFAVDRAALRREFPDVVFHDFESWAKTQDWNALLQKSA